MKLKIHQLERNKHEDIVVAVDWTSSNELLSASDDGRILRWGIDGAYLGELLSSITPAVTDIHCMPGPGSVMALAQSTGQFMIASSTTGKIEVTVAKQHQGSITCIRFNSDGTALVTAGEDGKILQWSRSGNLRSKLVSADTAVYCVSWAPDNQSVLYASGPYLVIKPLRVDDKQIRWRGSTGLILAIDWSPINNQIVCGGESCKYSIFDMHGRTLFVSRPLESSITSVRWAPNGAMLGVAALDTLLLCDQSGWAISRDSPNTGSVMSLSWTTDGTHLGGAGVNGAVVFAQVIDRTVQWKHLEATLNDHNQIIVSNALVDFAGKSFEHLEFSDRVIELALEFGHLVVATSRQLYSYNIDSFSTPHIFDVKSGSVVHLILPVERFFVIVGNGVVGIRVYSYEGREMSVVKLPGLQTELLKAKTITVSPDAIAVIDRSKQNRAIVFIDPLMGTALGKPFNHTEPIISITLSQFGLASDRKLAFIDSNLDLFITMIHSPRPVKLATLACSTAWNTDNDSLSAIVDTRLRIWYYPNVIFVDKDLLATTTESVDEQFGRNAEITEFTGTRCTVRRQDGASIGSSVSPYPSLLYGYCSAGQWGPAARLARFVQDPIVWSCLGAMAINGRELDTAEECFASIDAVDKLQNVQFIKSLTSKPLRDAELALFRRRPAEAEQILMSNNMPFRAIRLNLRMCKWQRALELANKYNAHIDTVVAYRRAYLQQFKQQEMLPEFLKLGDSVKIDWAAIEAKKHRENELEGGTRAS